MTSVNQIREEGMADAMGGQVVSVAAGNSVSLAIDRDGLVYQVTHPTPYTLHPTLHTLHPSPFTLHPTHHLVHPTPCTLLLFLLVYNPRCRSLNALTPRDERSKSLCDLTHASFTEFIY